MDVLISKQVAIDAFYTATADGDKAEWGISIINSLPPAQPEHRWIPVTERLPDLWDERYLVSLAWGGVGTMEYKSTGFHNYGSFSPVPIETVTAWMPLPEPWKG